MDYWLSKFMYDLKDADLRAQFRADPEAVIGRYPLTPDVRKAALDGDIPFLQPLVNAYLLRFYFNYRGMGDEEFINAVRGCVN
jgi:hypothetical protein